MNDNFLDPRGEKLVALLYGELSPDEEREVRKLLAEDPKLKAQWDEMTSMRAVLHEWEVSEKEPSFVFVDEPAAGRVGWRRWFRGLAASWTWGLATATAIVAILAFAHFRVDRADGGFALAFGSPVAKTPVQVVSLPPGEQAHPLGGVPASETVGGGPTTGPAVSGPAIAEPAGETPYLTRSEFAAYSAGMMQTLVTVLNQYGRERDQQVANALQTSLSQIAGRQTQDYGDLQNRIEQVRLGVADRQYQTDAQLQYLMQQAGQGRTAPAASTPGAGTKGEK